MSGRASISAYTPSNTDPEVLKRIFVQRERLLEKIVERLARSMNSGDKHHALLIGPRGSGKTHLVSLAVHELQGRHELDDKMRIAWLGEDDVFAGLVDIALGIADRLAVEYPDEFDTDYRTPVRGLPPDDAAISILSTVVERLEHRNIILITENMDRTFGGLGDMGQKKWRAFLQETPRIATLATSQQLFAGVADRKEAFFGFFDIHHLKPLTVEDARELIRKIGVEQGKTELVSFLNSSEGRYRIRALHHLAGGNHRMYVLLAEFLTKDSLDDLIEAFENLAEDLTPYFQERVGSLPQQQAKLVQCLCRADGAMTVKEIAEESFVAERNCSKQLGNLKQKGYVQSEKRGKESYYEMAEPLMRLCLDVKNQRGRPLRLVAQFLRAWFPDTSLQNPRLEQVEDSRFDEYRSAAGKLGNTFESAVAANLKNEIRERIDTHRFEHAVDLVGELQFADPVSAQMFNAEVAFRREDYVTAIEAFSEVIALADTPLKVKAAALFERGATHREQGNAEQALADYSAVIDMADATPNQKLQALLGRGATHDHQGNVEQALADFSAVIETADATPNQKLQALLRRGATYGQGDNVEQMLADCSAVIDVANTPPDVKAKVLFVRGLTHGQQGNVEQELADYSAVIEMADAPTDFKAKALVNRGVAHGQQGSVEHAKADFSAVIEMADAPTDQKARALVNRGVTHYQQGDVEQVLADYSSVIEMADAPPDQRAKALLGRGVTHGQQGDVGQALAAYSAVIDMADAPAEQKAKALLVRGATYHQQGDVEQELADYSAVIDMADAPAEQKAGALFGRALARWLSGEFKMSQEDVETVLTIVDVSSEPRTMALFALPGPMIAHSERADVITALTSAFEKGDSESESYGGTPGDLLSMVLQRGHLEWAAYIDALAPLYIQHGSADKLGKGVTKSIGHLDSGEYSDKQLDIWNAAWQEAGKDCDELEIPLRCLDAAVEVMKTKSDRPLFRLPLEIREIVRPLLENSLAE